MARKVKAADVFVTPARWTKTDGEFVPLGGPAIPEVTNAEKLSLPANTPVGTRVRVTDGFYLDAGSSEATGFYTYRGTSGSRPWNFYNRVDKPTTNPDNTTPEFCVFRDEDEWFVQASGGQNFYSTDNDPNDAVEPWDESNHWILGDIGENPTPVLTHPAVQRLAAPSTAQGGVFVSGGTQDGIYTDRGLDSGNGIRETFGWLGQDAVGYLDPFAIGWNGDEARWQINDDSATMLYYSLSNVATPDLATNWKNASDDSPASITVTSVSVGELNAGLDINGVTRRVNGSANSRNRYSDVLGVAPDIYFNGVAWTDGTIESDATDFLWNGSGDLAGSRNDVASEANWETV